MKKEDLKVNDKMKRKNILDATVLTVKYLNDENFVVEDTRNNIYCKSLDRLHEYEMVKPKKNLYAYNFNGRIKFFTQDDSKHSTRAPEYDINYDDEVEG